MTKILPKQNADTLVAKEEHQLNWDEILGEFKQTFGNHIYQSWIKNINLKK